MPDNNERSATALEPWDQIRQALEDERWSFRTIDGIAKETGIAPVVIERQLEMHKSEVRKSIDWKSTPYDILYTTRSRKPTLREIMSDLQGFARG